MATEVAETQTQNTKELAKMRSVISEEATIAAAQAVEEVEAAIAKAEEAEREAEAAEADAEAAMKTLKGENGQRINMQMLRT